MARYNVYGRTSVTNVLLLNAAQAIGSLLVAGATVATVKALDKKAEAKPAVPVKAAESAPVSEIPFAKPDVSIWSIVLFFIAFFSGVWILNAIF